MYPKSVGNSDNERLGYLHAEDARAEEEDGSDCQRPLMSDNENG